MHEHPDTGEPAGDDGAPRAPAPHQGLTRLTGLFPPWCSSRTVVQKGMELPDRWEDPRVTLQSRPRKATTCSNVRG